LKERYPHSGDEKETIKIGRGLEKQKLGPAEYMNIPSIRCIVHNPLARRKANNEAGDFESRFEPLVPVAFSQPPNVRLLTSRLC